MSMDLRITDFLGKRMLITTTTAHRSQPPFEVLVLEISPSRRWVLCRFITGIDSWLDPDDHVVVETLPDKVTDA